VLGSGIDYKISTALDHGRPYPFVWATGPKYIPNFETMIISSFDVYVLT